MAKDFNVTSKVISQILTDYIAAPKNHMQVLETSELDVIFEYMTQHNQVASLEEVFKVRRPSPPPRKEKAQPRQGGGEARRRAQGRDRKAAAGPAKPAPSSAQPSSPSQKQKKPHTPRQVAEKRVVDTRGGAAVNIEKYNEKFEDMAGAKANKPTRAAASRRSAARPSSAPTASRRPPPSGGRRSATR